MKTYNKLVRDKIPEIIASTGKPFDIHYAKKEERGGFEKGIVLEKVYEYMK